MRWTGLFLIAAGLASGQQFDRSMYGALRWRTIGPFRGGRTVAAAGIPSQPNVFYVAANNGGVWKTDDYGHTWNPVFDDQPTGSIGALAIAPSDPKIIYVGSGEGLHRPDLSIGDGIYKSTDGGRTWTHLGLRDAQQIPVILVDPRDPNRVFAAALGHPYGPNPERGVFRSDDGGATFQKVLYKDENTGAMELVLDPRNPDILYAGLWASREGPWENGAWHGKGSGLYKSLDGGNTWRQLTRGLPSIAQGLGRIGLGIAPCDSNRIYALVDAAPDYGGLYVSGDAGQTWRRINDDLRLWGRGFDFAGVRADPKSPDVVYVANISTYRSTDAGKTFTAIKGAPGGDDYHTIWINPDHPEIILLASDQGATLSVNHGRTWSSWYNQPTAQFYHVSTDNRFPYWVYGGQQESGSAGVASRGNDGSITFRDWHPVGAEEYGYVAADPLNPNYIYGGRLTRYDARTGQVQNVGPAAVRSEKYRFLRTAPLLFSPVDPHILYFASQVMFKTVNGAQSWETISPDLTRAAYEIPPSVGVFTPDAKQEATRRGVIYTIAPSPRDVNLIWAGTDDGLIHVTRDGGKSWKNVTPPVLTAWSKISIMDASHFDSATAYAVVNRFRLDDLRPHIYSTHDGGTTWKEIVEGLPDDPINVVREDPVRKGLLYAGSERAVYVSFNDGELWQPLRLNMPATSVRDLVVHDNDLVAGTHGRGFWILDNVTPLRQLNGQVARSEAFLYRPAAAYRVRRSVGTDTPLPPEEPAGENPPDGAIIDYWLNAPAGGAVTLEIFSSARRLVRRYRSTDPAEPVDPRLNLPRFWVRPPRILPASAGMHRFEWDLRYPPPAALHHRIPISAIPHDTPAEPLGVLVLPGTYTVKLTVGGKSFSQPLLVKMDPRVRITSAALAQQFALATKVVQMIERDYEALQEVRALRGRAALDEELAELNRKLEELYEVIEGADTGPTTQAVAAASELERSLEKTLAAWRLLR